MGTNLMSLAQSGGKFLKLYGDSKMVSRWKNPYVTYGLVAMWDGEWNAGPGVSDMNQHYPVNLIAGSPIQVEFHGTQKFAKHILFVPNEGYATGSTGDFSGWRGITIEYCNDSDTQVLDSLGTLTCGWINYYQASSSRRLGIFRGNGYRTVDIFKKNGSNYFGTSNWKYPSFYKPYFCTVSASLDNSFSESGIYCRGNLISSSEDTSNLISSTTTEFSMHFDYSNGVISPEVERMHCVRIYNRGLTADEIAANYAIDKARFNLPD